MSKVIDPKTQTPENLSRRTGEALPPPMPGTLSALSTEVKRRRRGPVVGLVAGGVALLGTGALVGSKMLGSESADPSPVAATAPAVGESPSLETQPIIVVDAPTPTEAPVSAVDTAPPVIIEGERIMLQDVMVTAEPGVEALPFFSQGLGNLQDPTSILLTRESLQVPSYYYFQVATQNMGSHLAEYLRSGDEMALSSIFEPGVDATVIADIASETSAVIAANGWSQSDLRNIDLGVSAIMPYDDIDNYKPGWKYDDPEDEFFVTHVAIDVSYRGEECEALEDARCNITSKMVDVTWRRVQTWIEPEEGAEPILRVYWVVASIVDSSPDGVLSISNKVLFDGQTPEIRVWGGTLHVVSAEPDAPTLDFS